MPDDMDYVQERCARDEAFNLSDALRHPEPAPVPDCVECGGTDGAFGKECRHYAECVKDAVVRFESKRRNGAW